MISEVVCRELFRIGGIFVLDAVIVEVPAAFAVSWNDAPDIPWDVVSGGSYFGTVHRTDVVNGPPPTFQLVEDPVQIVRIWVFDSLVGNLDRETEGNLLLKVLPSGKVRLIAADQSDCFCGSTCFSDGSWRDRLRGQPASECPFVAEAIASTGGSPSLQAVIQSAQGAVQQVGDAFEQVPEEWWEQARITPGDIEQTLLQRLENLETILRVEEWGEFNYGQYDGIPLL